MLSTIECRIRDDLASLCAVVARGSQIVAMFAQDIRFEQLVHVYTGHHGTWTLTATFEAVGTCWPWGIFGRIMAFSPDGMCVAVLDVNRALVTWMRVLDGKRERQSRSAFVYSEQLATVGAAGEWITSAYASAGLCLQVSPTVECFNTYTRALLGDAPVETLFVTLVPEVGSVVEFISPSTGTHEIIFFSVASYVDMELMSTMRVVWMGAVARALSRWGR